MNKMREQIAAAAVGPAQVTDQGGRQDYCFNRNFAGFAGHFPGYPVFPAVLQMLVAQQLAEQLAGERLGGLLVERAKFMGQLVPGAVLTVQVRLARRADGLQVNADLSTPAGAVSRFTLVFKGDADR